MLRRNCRCDPWRILRPDAIPHMGCVSPAHMRTMMQTHAAADLTYVPATNSGALCSSQAQTCREGGAAVTAHTEVPPCGLNCNVVALL